MRRDSQIHRGQTDSGPGHESRAGVGDATSSEDIHVRSYDHQQAYDLDIEVVTTAGELVFRERYYLRPGQTESEVNALSPGEYEFRATLDNSHREEFRCRIDSTPDHTAVIEIGNGVLSLTEGLPL